MKRSSHEEELRDITRRILVVAEENLIQANDNVEDLENVLENEQSRVKMLLKLIADLRELDL